jgi:cell division protein FtsN
VQQGTMPDKGVRFRVRLGPYDNTEELNRIRSDLTRNGFDVAVIKF